MDIVSVDPRIDPLWKRLAERHEASSVFHSPQWIRVITATYGWDAHAVVLVDGGGEAVAGISFCKISDMINSRIASFPFSDYCDPLVGRPEEWDMLIERLTSDGHPVTVRCLHNDLPAQIEPLVAVKRAKWHAIDLSPNQEELWQRVHSSSRRAITKAQRAGVQIKMAETVDELQAFYALHVRVRKLKYRMLAQPYALLENIWREFVEPGDGALMLAVHDEQIIGGVLFLQCADTLYYKFNASLADHLEVRPNDLLMWEGMRYGKARGFATLDLGLSDWDQEGLLRYKRKFATEEKTITFLRSVQSAPPTAREQEVRAMLTQLTNLFTDPDVPDHVTSEAGTELYRYFG